MKKLLLLLSIPLLSITQQTYVPDNNFEAYLENNGMGNGIPYDDYVTTKNINTITYLDVSMGAGSNTGIFDLTGIEDFTNLTELDCSYNQLTELNISQNTQLLYLICYNNQLTELNVSQNTQLLYLACYYNQLTELNVSQNIQLTSLICYNNQLTELDVSQNTQLTFVWCTDNEIDCIQVWDVQYPEQNFWYKDNDAIWSLDCGYETSILELSINKILIKTADITGGETTKKGFTIEIYDDGSVEKKYVME